MRGRMVMWMMAVAVLALAVPAGAAYEGELDRAGLQKQAAANKALERYMRRNGYPDVAEVRPIVDQPPWDNHEVTLYYFKSHKEISFARARVLGRPEVYMPRYERTLTDADVRALQGRATGLNAEPIASAGDGSCKGSAADRAECAAGRAESAADRVDVAAVRAEKAADRTEAIVEKMSRPRKSSRH